MSQTIGERRAYSRGYQSGATWPLHIPPEPPGEVTRALVQALRKVRVEMDDMQATIDPEDDFAARLNASIDTVDSALEKLGQWIKKEVASNAGEPTP